MITGGKREEEKAREKMNKKSGEEGGEAGEEPYEVTSKKSSVKMYSTTCILILISA